MSEARLDFITWKSTPRVQGVFSLKNPQWNPSAEIPGLNLGYNTIEEDSITQRNRALWLEAAGAKPEKTSWGIQIHKNHVQVVEKAGVFPNTDALVTNVPGFSLGVFVADCAAILLADKQAGVIGAVHAGWKGAVAGVLPNAVEEMRKLGAKTSKMEAFVSPCISKEKFEVGEEVAVQFPESVTDRSYQKPHIDLKKFVVDQLLDEGVPETAIKSDPGCTFSEADRFYSFRREKKKSGRMMALITLKK